MGYIGEQGAIQVMWKLFVLLRRFSLWFWFVTLFPQLGDARGNSVNEKKKELSAFHLTQEKSDHFVVCFGFCAILGGIFQHSVKVLCDYFWSCSCLVTFY